MVVLRCGPGGRFGPWDFVNRQGNSALAVVPSLADCDWEGERTKRLEVFRGRVNPRSAQLEEQGFRRKQFRRIEAFGELLDHTEKFLPGGFNSALTMIQLGQVEGRAELEGKRSLLPAN